MVPWKVEKCRLEEKHEADPLVVLVVALVIFIPRRRCDPCMGIVYPLLADDSVRDRVGGMDPTIGVLKVAYSFKCLNHLIIQFNQSIAHHDIVGYLFDNAVNWISNILPRGNEKRGHNQDEYGALVVQAEDVVVDADALELDQALDGPKDIKHVG